MKDNVAEWLHQPSQDMEWNSRIGKNREKDYLEPEYNHDTLQARILAITNFAWITRERAYTRKHNTIVTEDTGT